MLHLLLRARRGEPGAEGVLEAVRAFTAHEPNQVIAFSVLGGRADLGLMALGPDLDALDALAKRVLAGPVEPVYSFVSLTELSEYTSTEDEERARLEAEGADDLEARLGEWRARMESYLDARLHPRLPQRADDRLLPHVQAPRGARQLVLAALRGAQAADGRPRGGGPALRRARAAAHHRRDRARRLGVGRDPPGRRPGRREGHRLRDALRRGERPLRRVRALLRGAGDGARGGAGARRPRRRGLTLGEPQDALDRDRMRERVEHRAVTVGGLGELLVAGGGLGPLEGDLDAKALVAGAGAVVGAEEAAEVEIARHLDPHPVEGDAELGRPEPVGDGLARREAGQQELDGALRRVGPAERARLVGLHGVVAHRGLAAHAGGGLGGHHDRHPGASRLVAELLGEPRVGDLEHDVMLAGRRDRGGGAYPAAWPPGRERGRE